MIIWIQVMGWALAEFDAWWMNVHGENVVHNFYQRSSKHATIPDHSESNPTLEPIIVTNTKYCKQLLCVILCCVFVSIVNMIWVNEKKTNDANKDNKK